MIGPDEYHEDVDDNAFTNAMARWNLQQAADVGRPGEAEEAALAQLAPRAGRTATTSGRAATSSSPATSTSSR